MSFISRVCASRSQRKKICASRNRLYRVALAWCGDPMLADDLVQEALTLGIQRVHQLRDEKCLSPWLYSILNNCWKQHLRRFRPHEDLDEECPGTGALEPETAIGRMEMVSKVRSAVAELPVEQRKVLALVDLEGFSYSEVSDILEIPIGTVMSRLHRARKSLLVHFKEAGDPRPGKAPILRRVK